MVHKVSSLIQHCSMSIYHMYPPSLARPLPHPSLHPVPPLPSSPEQKRCPTWRTLSRPANRLKVVKEAKEEKKEAMVMMTFQVSAWCVCVHVCVHVCVRVRRTLLRKKLSPNFVHQCSLHKYHICPNRGLGLYCSSHLTGPLFEPGFYSTLKF